MKTLRSIGPIATVSNTAIEAAMIERNLDNIAAQISDSRTHKLRFQSHELELLYFFGSQTYSFIGDSSTQTAYRTAVVDMAFEVRQTATL